MTNTPTPDQLFGLAVKKLREEQGWSMSEFADILSDGGLSNFHPTTIGRMERGERPVRLSEAVMIARVFRVSVDELIDEPYDEDLAEYIHLLESSSKRAGRWVAQAASWKRQLEELVSELEGSLAEGSILPERVELVREACQNARAFLSGPDLVAHWTEKFSAMSDDEYREFVQADNDLKGAW